MTKSISEILEELNQPFDPEDVKWLPGVFMGQGKVQALAYADPRVYIDRLNEVLGAANWGKSYNTTIATGLTKVVKQYQKENLVLTGTGKIFVTCTVNIPSLGVSTSDVGESDLSDDNAYTVAASQAFKRACVQFGLGRYFYDLPKYVIKYSKEEGFSDLPTLS